jgi:hypothetical protein
VPPTEAELKVLEARRERQDKISKLLGEYLLKGDKMLGTTCSACDVRQHNIMSALTLLSHRSNVMFCFVALLNASN